MEYIAHVYVNHVEPTLKVVFFLIIGFLIILIIRAVGDAKKREELISGAFKLLVAFVKNTVKFIGLALSFVGIMLHKIIKEVYKVISDFFTSKI